MKMPKNYWMSNLKNWLGLLILLVSVIACQPKGDKDAQSITITNGSLTMVINEQMETRLNSNLDGSKALMEGFQPSEKLQIGLSLLNKFDLKNSGEKKLTGKLAGKQWTFEGNYKDADANVDVTKILKVTAYDDFPGLLSTKVSYINNSSEPFFVQKWVNNDYNILQQGDSPAFWAFQGSSSSSRSDWIKPLDSTYYQKNYMGMNDSDYGGGVPVTSVWRRDVNVAVGHLSMVPELVNLPTEMAGKQKNVEVGVSKEFPDHTALKSKDTLSTLETFVSVSKGDYYANLDRYSRLMQKKGIEVVPTEDAAFESVWCAWGYERDFTLKEIIGTLPKVKELGIKWAVLDDGFQIAEGDWNANPKKFPKGNSEIKGLVNKIHSYGLKAKIWWTPLAADPDSKVLKEYPGARLMQKDGSPQFITWWDAYYLSPANAQTVQYTKEVVQLFMKDWGFDGLKMDGQHMNATAPDYNLDNPESAPQELPAFFMAIYNEARSIKPHAVVENCPCGTCMSYYNMASMNQAVSSDPISSWQIRLKGKTYKALVPHTAYYGDHVELSDNADDFASSFGVGAVLGTKFTWPKDNPHASDSFLLTPEKEKKWKKWFALYDQKMLSKEEYLGNLYDIGYDKPETHVIKKSDTLYYAFYNKDWHGKIELRGLDKAINYHVVDYFNNKDLGKIAGKTPEIDTEFKEFLLLEVTPR